MFFQRLRDDDWSLLKRIHRGDRDAVRLLYDRYSRVVYSIALRVLCDPVRAEQVLSEIFLYIWRKSKYLTPAPCSLSVSMAMIARNRAVEELLHKPASDFDFPLLEGMANCMERAGTREEARVLIETLPHERRALLERVFFNRTLQLGASCSCSPKTPKTPLFHLDSKAVPTVRKRRLTKPTLSVFMETGRAVPIPAGAVIEMQNAPDEDRHTVDVTWDGKDLMMYVYDLENRSLEVF